MSGLRYAHTMIAAPLSAGLLPRPNLSRVGLVASWEDEQALDAFLASDARAEELAQGWQVRLQPTRAIGAWPKLDGLPEEEVAMDDGEPVAVLTLGRLRASQTGRFLRASAAAEGLAVREPGLLKSTGLARPPALVATFSLWRTTAAMRAYARGATRTDHLSAVKQHATRPFHRESVFIRFRPYHSEGSWDGQDPLSASTLLER